MGNLIHAGLFCCLLFVKVGVCLSLGDEDVSDSFLQVLMRKLQEQDKKISVIEANRKLDHKNLFSKILRLEEKLKDSDSKQLKLKKTIRNMDKIIKELKTKLWTKIEDYLNEKHSLKQENPDSEPTETVFQNTTGEDRSVAVKSKPKKILNGGVHPSKLSFTFKHCYML